MGLEVVDVESERVINDGEFRVREIEIQTPHTLWNFEDVHWSGIVEENLHDLYRNGKGCSHDSRFASLILLLRNETEGSYFSRFRFTDLTVLESCE